MTTLASPTLTVPLGQYLNAGLNQSHLRGMTGRRKGNVWGFGVRLTATVRMWKYFEINGASRSCFKL